MTVAAPMFRKTLALCVLVGLAVFQASAQTIKRPLAHSDYDSWKSIQDQQLTRDGKFLAYALVPQSGDGEIVVRNLATGQEWRQARGSRPEAPPAGEQAEPTPPVPRQSSASRGLAFSADGTFAAFTVYPTKAELDQARKQKKKAEDMPKSGLGLMDLRTGTVIRIDRVKRFEFPEDGTGFIAYLREAAATEKNEGEKKAADPASPDTDEDQQNSTAGPRPEKKKEYGTDLVLRSQADGSERVFPDVTEFSFSRDGNLLVYTVSAKTEETNGVYVVKTGTADKPRPVLAGKGRFTKLTWDENATQLVFLSDTTEAGGKRPNFRLYHWKRDAEKAEEIVAPSTPGMPAGYAVNDRAALDFSFDGGKVFLGTAPIPSPAPENDDTPESEKVAADLWHWRDDFIQPMQKVRAERERNRSYRAVFHLAERKFVQLCDPTMPEALVPDQGRWILGIDDRPYRTLVAYDANYADYYLVDTTDGSRRLLVRKQQFPVSWSPNGVNAAYYDGKDWIGLDVPSGKTVNLTAKTGVSFAREEHDSPSTSPSYGLGGWTADDRSILAYDRYDIWRFSIDGATAENLTKGLGRKEKTEFRYVKLDPKERGIDLTRPFLLEAENETTRDSGFFRLSTGAPEKLLWAAKRFGTPAKAAKADVHLFTASTFAEFPDLLVSGGDFKNPRKVTDANPQKSGLTWGTAELVHYKNSDGLALDGILIKPDNFDPSKKYPMIVYIYERLSQELHRFVPPAPGTSINISYYASNGYLVLMPDIAYTVGYPGQSAMKCVIPAIQSVVDRGFVNEGAIGIQGHSWGGYQIAYMVTQTNRFKAAAAGAPVANMVSAYNGIRWGTGLPRQFQYERTQSRIGGTLWEYPTRFLDNSPIFQADRVQTPLLLLHNDADDAVPWYQGIEYFLALRRLGKEAYLFNYNGEPHGLRRRPNQKDYTLRLQQFFDHHLKGAAKPKWMESGIPYLQRDAEKKAAVETFQRGASSQ